MSVHSLWGWRLAGGAVLAALIVGSWAPFQLDPPRLAQNGIEMVDGVGWRLAGAPLALTHAPPAWVDDIMAGGSATIDLRVRPAQRQQTGPARILAVSDPDDGGQARDLRYHNLMIGQEGTDLVVRVRRPDTDPRGSPALIKADVFQPDTWTDIRVVVGPTIVVEVDGVTAVAEDVGGWQGWWDPTFVLSVGNTPSGVRPWHGVIAAATITSGGAVYDVLGDSALVTPDRVWVIPERLRAPDERPLSERALIGVVHIIVGAALVCTIAWALPRARPRSALATSMLLSIVVNAGKILIAGRHPSVVTVLLQASGATAGFLAVVRPRGGNDRSDRSS